MPVSLVNCAPAFFEVFTLTTNIEFRRQSNLLSWALRRFPEAPWNACCVRMWLPYYTKIDMDHGITVQEFAYGAFRIRNTSWFPFLLSLKFGMGIPTWGLFLVGIKNRHRTHLLYQSVVLSPIPLTDLVWVGAQSVKALSVRHQYLINKDVSSFIAKFEFQLNLHK